MATEIRKMTENQKQMGKQNRKINDGKTNAYK